jgi:multiple sugar transport system permease protein
VHSIENEKATMAKSKSVATATARWAKKRTGAGPQVPASTLAKGGVIPYLFSIPSILMVSIILAYPVIWGIVQSFYRRELGQEKFFVGFDNYIELAASDTFWASLERTGIFVAGGVIIGTGLGLVFAFALNNALGSLRFLRGVSIAPYIVSSVAAAVMFRILFNDQFGPVNKILQAFGGGGLPWLSDGALAMLVVIVAQVWGDMPLTVLILLAGLQMIDKSYLEAALVDGASPSVRAREITLPLLAPQIAITVIWQSYSSMTGLGIVLALTGGGPLEATLTLPVEMYQLAFISFKEFEALAIGTIVLFINALLTLIYLRLSKRYGAED